MMHKMDEEEGANYDFVGPAATALDMHWKAYAVRSKRKEDPIAIVAVGIREGRDVYGRNISVYVVDTSSYEHAKLPYMMDGKGWTPDFVTVKTTPGDVLIKAKSMRGRGIGYLVFNEVIRWAKRTHKPETPVMPITLVRSKNTDDEDWDIEYEKLTKFYGRFGFKWKSPPLETDPRHFPSDSLYVRDLQAREESTLEYIKPVYVPSLIARVKSMRTIIEKRDRRIQRLKDNVVEQRRIFAKRGRLKMLCYLSVGLVIGVVAGTQL